MPTETSSEYPETAYQVVLSQGRLVLSYGIPYAALDYVALHIRNTQGTVVESWKVNEPDDEDYDQNGNYRDSQGYEDWKLLSGLFHEVHRRATGWDRVLSEIEKALAGQGVIGERPTNPSKPVSSR